LTVKEQLGPSSALFLSKLVQYYNYISIFAAYLGAISLVLVALAGRNEISSPAVTILMGSIMAAIATVTTSTMIQFTLHRSELYFQRTDLIVGSIPLFLLDVTVLATPVGLLMWCTSNLSPRFATYVGIGVIIFLTILMVVVAVWAWERIINPNCSGDFNIIEIDNATGRDEFINSKRASPEASECFSKSGR
jgi:hypothetical protein